MSTVAEGLGTRPPAPAEGDDPILDIDPLTFDGQNCKVSAQDDRTAGIHGGARRAVHSLGTTSHDYHARVDA